MTPLIDWDSPDEQWAPVPGHEGYEASTHGRVRSPRGVLKPWTSNRIGHLKIGLNGRRREWLHRVICLAFYGPCPPELEVRHLDGDPTNNHVGNLRYGTHSENMQDRLRHGGWTGEVPTSPHIAKTHCPQRHPYDDANTLRYGGKRACRVCTAERKAAYVKRQAGVTVTCDACGNEVSKLNLHTHKKTLRCQAGAR